MNAVVFGAQWGDEGKGKVASYMARHFDVNVRFQGGSNAGHTVIRKGKHYKFSTLPCGVLEPGVRCVIGSGVVLDMPVLVSEIKQMELHGINMDNLMIADNLSVILPIHRELDNICELSRCNKIGTTGRGIGICYEDRVGRRAVRLSDVLEGGHHLRSIIEEAVQCRKLPDSWVDNCLEELNYHADIVTPFAVHSTEIFKLCSSKESKVLYEGSQGFWLDIYHGTYPYVTSSSIMPAQACLGTPTSTDSLGIKVGVAKAYVTRVGNGPMPTEQKNDVGELLASKGNEFGTVTRRKRRCGWFDAVAVRQALQFSSAKALVLTKIDILEGMSELQICVGYRLHNKIIDYYPSSNMDQESMKPIYEKLHGWPQTVCGNVLSKEARAYVSRIEELVGVPVVMASTTPRSEEMLLINEQLANMVLHG